jgi:hypothetical protein
VTTQISSNEQSAQTQAPETKSMEELSFSEYEAVRRGGDLPVKQKPSALANPAEQKKAEDSETSENDTDAEASESDDESDELEAKDDDESAEGKPKKKKGWSRRVEKLVAQREAERKRAEALEARLAALEAAGGSKHQESKADAKASLDGEPNASDFETHSEYVKAVVKWDREEAEKSAKEQAQKAKLEADQKALMKAHADRVKAFADKTEDYALVVADADIVLPDAAVEAILQSDVGPALIYELAKNRKEAERIAALSPGMAAREIGKLEAKLEAKASDQKNPEPKNTITKAPKPIEPVGGGKGAVTKSLDDPDLSFAEYERMRREQLKRKGG